MEAILEQLERITQQLERLNQGDDALWSIDDIAHHIRTQRRSAEVLTRHRLFPNPVRLPTTEKGGHPRWVAAEVKRFCLRFKG